MTKYYYEIFVRYEYQTPEHLKAISEIIEENYPTAIIEDEIWDRSHQLAYITRIDADDLAHLLLGPNKYYFAT